MSQKINSNTPEVGKIRIYAAGGAGVNIGSHFESKGLHSPGFADMQVCYIDTSRSNLARPNLNQDAVFLLEGVDGSGKVRTENHAEIGRNIRNILQQFKPEYFNVVVFSGAGGSGSVFGPLIVKELLDRGEAVVVILIGADESDISANNTIKTIKSLDAIAQKTNLPVVTFYRQNAPDLKRSKVDDDCFYMISSLSLLASRQNDELDSQDVINWAQYSRATSVAPRLALLTVTSDPAEVDAIAAPISIASLLHDRDAETYSVAPDYHCTGYLAEGVAKDVKALHMVVSFDGINRTTQRLEKRVEELAIQKAARVEHVSLSKGEQVGDDGLIL